MIGYDPDIIGNQHLFPQTDHKTLNSVLKIAQRDGTIDDLAGNIVVTHYRAGNQLGKERNIKGKIDKPTLHCGCVSVDIDNV